MYIYMYIYAEEHLIYFLQDAVLANFAVNFPTIRIVLPFLRNISQVGKGRYSLVFNNSFII